MSYNAKKSLSYEMEEPAFLRRLRQGQSGGEQQQRYIAPRNKKRSIDDDEDAPTYVLEGGNDTITVEEFKALNGSKSGDDKEDTEKDNTPAREEEAVADVGAAISLEKPLDMKKILEAGSKINKRKAVKMIGAGEGDDTTCQDDEKLGPPKRTGRTAKGKQRVKLSFGDDE
ncbi:hypothetical protein EV426DRAFT_708766 [Tirmania nivea]|nr:hypothetical protein EV426DRAFT_708766 [Tirmania nivea]